MLVRKNPRSGNNEANKTLAEKIEDYIKVPKTTFER